MVFFGRSKKGVDFDSTDKKPVYLFFLIMTPEGSAAAHLKALAGISHLLKNHDIKSKIHAGRKRPGDMQDNSRL